MRLRHSQNYAPRLEYYTPVSDVSETVPDQSMSIKTMVDRYQRGLPIQGQSNPQYYDDEEYPNLATMDLLEIKELRDSNHEQIKKLQKLEADAARAQDKKRSEKAFEAAVAAKIKEVTESRPSTGLIQ